MIDVDSLADSLADSPLVAVGLFFSEGSRGPGSARERQGNGRDGNWVDLVNWHSLRAVWESDVLTSDSQQKRRHDLL